MASEDTAPLKNSYNDAPPAYSPPTNQQQAGYGAVPQQNYPPNYAPGYQTGAPPGYQPMPGGNTPLAPPYGGTPVQVTTTNVVVVGGCPACRVGILEDDFTLLGVCCAILFFPLGILCCLAMRQRRCPNCGAVFG